MKDFQKNFLHQQQADLIIAGANAAGEWLKEQCKTPFEFETSTGAKVFLDIEATVLEGSDLNLARPEDRELINRAFEWVNSHRVKLLEKGRGVQWNLE